MAIITGMKGPCFGFRVSTKPTINTLQYPQKPTQPIIQTVGHVSMDLVRSINPLLVMVALEGWMEMEDSG